jgi:hypothetical protein
MRDKGGVVFNLTKKKKRLKISWLMHYAKPASFKKYGFYRLHNLYGYNNRHYYGQHNDNHSRLFRAIF